MSYNNVLIEQEENVRIITINRPKALNALNSETIAELSNAFKDAESDINTRVIIVTGSGDKAFVAGADIKEFAAYSRAEGEQLSRKGHESLFNLVENLSTPVIAAVNGFALGGGLELAMSAHIRIASDNARLGLPEVSLGVIPGYGGTQRLAQLIGKGKANEMIFSAGMMKADESLKWGLVNSVVSLEELLDSCKKLANKIAGNSPSAISQAIKVVNAGFVDGVNGFEEEIKAFGECFDLKDFKEGTSAFIEKRKPEFTGE